jgi:hypothetical protein
MLLILLLFYFAPEVRETVQKNNIQAGVEKSEQKLTSAKKEDHVTDFAITKKRGDF